MVENCLPSYGLEKALNSRERLARSLRNLQRFEEDKSDFMSIVQRMS
jgi:hypothetical protein